MAGITFSEAEVKKLILALAGSKAMGEEPEMDEEKPEVEDSEKNAEDKPEDKPEESAGKPFKESTKDMLEKKLKGEKEEEGK